MAHEESLEVDFTCARCGAIAATVRLIGTLEVRQTSDPTLADTFGGPYLDIDGGPLPTRHLLVRSPGAVLRALRGNDAAALAAIDPEYANFWCRTCGAAYCARHWKTQTGYDEGFYDDTHGTCPLGHKQLVDD